MKRALSAFFTMAIVTVLSFAGSGCVKKTNCPATAPGSSESMTRVSLVEQIYKNGSFVFPGAEWFMERNGLLKSLNVTPQNAAVLQNGSDVQLGSKVKLSSPDMDAYELIQFSDDRLTGLTYIYNETNEAAFFKNVPVPEDSSDGKTPRSVRRCSFIA